MKKFYKPFYLFGIVFLFIFLVNGNTQYSALENAEQTELILTASKTGTINRSGLVFNPLKEVYYSVNAGSDSYYVDSYNSVGELLDSVVSGFDFRGAWWNPFLFTFEGNGYNSLGIFSKAIDPFTGVAVAGGSIVAANTQPDAQSIGDMDTAKYEIIYFSAGSVYRYDRLDDQLLGTAVITGLPAGTVLNSNSVFYTGLEDMEYGVYDYANLKFIFINKLGEYVSHSQLPATAFPASNFRTSWANKLFWIYDSVLGKWFSYKVYEGFGVGIKEREINDSRYIKVFPNPVISETQLDFQNLSSEVIQIRLLNINGKVIKEFSDISSTEITLNLQNESNGIYILQLTTLEGETHFKKLIKQ